MEAEDMISRKELQEYAQIKNLNLGQAEKEYFQNIVLFILYEQFGKELVFKGGTALSKAYGLERFSEDLDFTFSTKEKEEKIREKVNAVLQQGMERFYLQTEIKEQFFANSFNCTVRIHGPLYNGVRHSLCKLQLDFSFREEVILEPQIITLGRLLKELPPFDAVVMAKEEILAEKVRAIITRTKARDVYDLWFLLQNGVLTDFDLIEKKLQYYRLRYSVTEFSKHLHLKKEIWESELAPLLPKVPSFTVAIRLILEKMGKIGKQADKSKKNPRQQKKS